MLGYNFGDSKITYFDLALMNEYIFGFYVSVDNAVLLQELQSYNHLGDISF